MALERCRRTLRPSWRLLVVASIVFPLWSVLGQASDWGSLRCRRSTERPGMVGDQPSHVRVESCGPAAQAVIGNLGFPANEIHCCAERKVALRSVQGAVVWVMYGPGEDCPAGCGYREWVGLWDGSTAHPLPDPRPELLVPGAINAGLLVERPTGEVANLSSTRGKVELAQWDGRYGWDVIVPAFQIREMKSGTGQTIFDRSGDMLNVGVRFETVWSGPLFVSQEGQTLRVDTSRMNQVLSEKTIYQECHYQRDPPPGGSSYVCEDYIVGAPPWGKYNPGRSDQR